MAESKTALEILRHPDDWSLGTPSLIVLVGDEPFLAFHMLALLRDRLCPDEADRMWAWREFAGDDLPDPRDVFDEAATVPLFAGATRAAIVRNADAFVSQARELLEDLPAPQREAIDLWCEGLTYRQIAEVTGRQEGHVRVLAHRGLIALRAHPLVRDLLVRDLPAPEGHRPAQNASNS